MSLLLLLTHLAVAGVAWFAGRWWALRHLAIREVDGHAALELQHHDEGPAVTIPDPDRRTQTRRTDDRRGPSTWLVVLLIASVLVITIGVSAFLANRRDAAQRACIVAFTSDLATTYQANTTAARRLERAKSAKDAAADRVFLIVSQARAVPPKATPKDFDRALHRFVEARRHLLRVQRSVDKIRSAHPLPAPDNAKVCTR